MIVDYAGPSELVTPETGFAVPIGSRAEIIAALRKTLDQVLEERSFLPAMAERARKRILDEFTWPAKARKVAAVYARVLANRKV